MGPESKESLPEDQSQYVGEEYLPETDGVGNEGHEEQLSIKLLKTGNENIKISTLDAGVLICAILNLHIKKRAVGELLTNFDLQLSTAPKEPYAPTFTRVSRFSKPPN